MVFGFTNIWRINWFTRKKESKTLLNNYAPVHFDVINKRVHIACNSTDYVKEIWGGRTNNWGLSHNSCLTWLNIILINGYCVVDDEWIKFYGNNCVLFFLFCFHLWVLSRPKFVGILVEFVFAGYVSLTPTTEISLTVDLNSALQVFVKRSQWVLQGWWSVTIKGQVK